MRALGAVLVLLALVVSCAHGGTTNEKHPVKIDLAQYRTCTLNVDADRMPSAEPDASAFEDYLSGRLKDGGVFLPLEMMEPGTPDLTLRIRIVDAKEAGSAADVRMVVTVVETRSGDELGEVEVTGSAKAEEKSALRGARRDALHRAADEIVDYLAKKRGTGKPAPESAPPQVAATPGRPTAEDPFRKETLGARQPICLSSCATPASSSLPEQELQRVTTKLDGPLHELRACLDRVGGEKVEPAVILRIGGDGRLVGMRIDMGGYEDLTCVDAVRTHPPPVQVRVPRESMIRCIFHCT